MNTRLKVDAHIIYELLLDMYKFFLLTDTTKIK